jgi:tRNA(Ile)-lysidine synthase
LDLVAVHVNHHLRDEADDDARFVARACEQLGVRCYVVDIQPGAGRGNVAANARELRYGALARAARAGGCAAVAVAHHAEDQFETMLMALCRGAGLDGLRGMPWRRGQDDVELLRPLLGVRKSVCEDFCRAAGLGWLEDPSNLRRDRARSRLRAEVVPVLEALWPGCAERTVGTAQVLESARQGFEERVTGVFGEPSDRAWQRKRLRGEAHAIVAAGLRRAALRMNKRAADELGQRQLFQAADAICSDETSPRRFDWPLGLRLCVDAEKAWLEELS